MVLEGDDPVWGSYRIADPLLLELHDATPVQRLKRICQGGIPQELDSTPDFSRYDHSLGVMLLLQRLGASREEQAAGLLHDVSHTAFSHVVDWVLGSATNEDYQDTRLRSFLARSEVPAILARHGVELEAIIDHHRHALLERDMPELCADRIDYALRVMALWMRPDAVPHCVDALRAHDGTIVFGSKDAAQLFATEFLRCQREYWGGADHVARYHVFAKALEGALTQHLIREEDFWSDDDTVMRKVRESRDPAVQDALRMLSRERFYTIDEEHPHIRRKKKFRYVDPLYLDGAGTSRLSDDPAFATLIAQERANNERGTYLRFDRALP